MAADLAGTGGPLNPPEARGEPVCPPVDGTSSGLAVKLWEAGSVNDSPVQLPLTEQSFTGPVDANGFPTRGGVPVPSPNTAADGGNSNTLSRPEWDALRVDGWVSAPCADESWELRFTIGAQFATYAGALKQGAQATAADILTGSSGVPPSAINGQLIGSATGKQTSAVVSLNLRDPVNVVELIADRGGAHSMEIEERVDSTATDAWTPVPADRIWEDKPPSRESSAPAPVEPPSVSITSVGPFAGPPGARGVVVGTGLGTSQGRSIMTVGGVPVGRTLLWRDTRIEFKVPDLPAGIYPVQIVINGSPVTIGQYVVEAIQPEPPTPNPVLVSGGGARVIFDASLSINPNSGATAQSLGRVSGLSVGISGISSVIWRFGDGTSSRQVAPSKTYTAPGTYNATLTVTDTVGRSKTTAQRIVVSGARGKLRASLPPVNLSIPDRVVFDAGSATLRKESKPALRKLAALLKQIGRRAVIGGHTDSIGPAGYNLRLSEDRAKAVRRFLVTEGKVSALVLTAVGFGESQPIATNGTPLGRQRNRRVTLKVARSTSRIRLDGRSLLINRRISTAVLLRERAIRDRLTVGLGEGDIVNGGLYSRSFGNGVEITGEETVGSPRVITPEKIKIPKLPRTTKVPAFTRNELARNNQLNTAAIKRVNALIDRVGKGLTGADVKDGALTSEKLAPGLTFGAIANGPAPAAVTQNVAKVPLKKLRPGPITEAMLLADQRRSQTAIRRLNVLLSQFREGFSVDDFAPGSLGSADVAKE